MQQILKFLIRFQVGILFLVLLGIALTLTINNHSFHQEKFISSTNVASSFFYRVKYDVVSYFNLKEDNTILQEENSYLQKQVFNLKFNESTPSTHDSLFDVIPTHVISNSYRKTRNHVLINGGEQDSIFKDYGVSLPNGILGIVEETTGHFSRVISILNTNLLINAKFKNNFQFGSLQWDGESYQHMQLNDIPRSATFNIGDTIVTGGNSLVFPEGILIGQVESYDLDNNKGYYNIKVKLFADMTNINEAYVIVPKQIGEAIKLLE